MARGERFAFGENWSRFLAVLDGRRIQRAEESVRRLLGRESLSGLRFLDVGSGSGLFSLAARRLGASVVSFDYDPQSVACTSELRRRFFSQDAQWDVREGSVLDAAFLAQLGTFDVVYSWGVLHHTGQMWQALGQVAPLVAPGGTLAVALYNDQGAASRLWLRIKRLYVRLPAGLRWLVLLPCLVRLWGPTMLKDLVRLRPFASWREYREQRGMSPLRDVIDWVGGYPFEVAKPEQVFEFFDARGFRLVRMTTCGGGLGCNEFVFRREP